MKKTMKNLKLLLLSISISFLFTGCTGIILGLTDALDPNQMEDNWAHKGYLRKLMKHPSKKEISKNETLKSAKAICELKHLRIEDKKNAQLIEYTKPFCSLEKGDKVYFYDWCIDCGSGGYNSKGTSYLLVREKKPIAAIQIAQKYSKELGRSIPIVERLH